LYRLKPRAPAWVAGTTVTKAIKNGIEVTKRGGCAGRLKNCWGKRFRRGFV
jgi:hypothetical protein